MAAPEVREEQQAALLRILRSAGGTPVSYATLQGHGIEFPASVAAELELEGVEVERCHLADAPHDADGSRRLGLRLAPERDPDGAPPAYLDPAIAASHAPEAREPHAAERRRLLARMAHPRIGLISPIVAAGAIAAAIATLGGSAAPTQPHATATRPPATRHGRSAAAHARRRGRSGRAALSHRATAATGERDGTLPSTPSRPSARMSERARARSTVEAGSASARARRHLPRAPVSTALATRLEAEGHGLIEAGRAATAIPILTRAVAATGEHVDACRQPSAEECLTYAYALYDLGHALQLSGRPGASIPILRERLQIDNQRPAVQAELDLALAQARRGG